MRFAAKADLLLSQGFDVAVVSECSEASIHALEERGYEKLWFGANRNKGIGVLSRAGWAMHGLSQPPQKWIAPIQIDGPVPFLLLAVWACRSGDVKTDDYIGQVYQALIDNPEWFGGRPVILAGDLNSNRIWDAEREVGNHSQVVRLLAENGLVSGYHEFFHEEQGKESRPTTHHCRRADRPYHIDYIFVPREWRVESVEVGTPKM